MKKKTYISPSIDVQQLEPTVILTGSGPNHELPDEGKGDLYEEIPVNTTDPYIKHPD